VKTTQGRTEVRTGDPVLPLALGHNEILCCLPGGVPRFLSLPSSLQISSNTNMGGWMISLDSDRGVLLSAKWDFF
jgi:hypothetical protein